MIYRLALLYFTLALSLFMNNDIKFFAAPLAIYYTFEYIREKYKSR